MRVITFIAALLLVTPVTGQLNKQLYDSHNKYLEKSVVPRRFKQEDVTALVGKLGPAFRVRQVGRSAEGRAISLISYGNGPVNVLMWSQMHGDETTATRAILDIFRFLQADDSFNNLRTKINSSITWHFIPMLNPDGAARFARRNHDGIDINRDALRLQTPEGRTLKRVRDSLKAGWGFNLHDQGRGTSVNGKPATISLLAPPFNQASDVNETRGDAMQLTKYLHDQITAFIPGQIGIYADDFEPRAFGDNMQKWGTRTILIESGGFGDDYEKQEIRRLNFVLLVTAADAIADSAYEKVPVDSYYEIPKNADGRMMELIIYNLNYEGLRRDIGIDRREIDSEDFRKYYAKGFISDIGDLSTAHAYKTFDASDYIVKRGKVYEPVLESIGQLEALDTQKLLGEGFTDFIVKDFDPFNSAFPYQVHSKVAMGAQGVQMGGNPSLIFERSGVVEFALINGVVIALK